MRSRRHRVLAGLLAAVLGTSASGCFHIRAAAPPLPAHVRLLPPDAPVEVSRKYQTFYYAWGLFPMNQADQVMYIIEQEHLVEARVVQGGQWQGILAGFIGAIAISGFVLPQNIAVEGNRTPTLPAAEPAAEPVH
jgi:hypothetical protein